MKVSQTGARSNSSWTMATGDRQVAGPGGAPEMAIPWAAGAGGSCQSPSGPTATPRRPHGGFHGFHGFHGEPESPTPWGRTLIMAPWPSWPWR